MHVTRRRHQGVQELLPLEEISGDVVVLRGGECRAVLQLTGLHFALRAEAEQEAILAGYRNFLNGLTFPLQLLVRVVPADIERYLAGLGERGADRNEALRRLALDHEEFARRLARERTLLDRRFYLVIPAGAGAGPRRPAPAWPWRRASGERGREGSGPLAASRRLAFRCAEVAQQLAPLGVATRRLGDEELLRLWRECLGNRGPALGSRGPVVTATREEAARA